MSIADKLGGPVPAPNPESSNPSVEETIPDQTLSSLADRLSGPSPENPTPEPQKLTEKLPTQPFGSVADRLASAPVERPVEPPTTPASAETQTPTEHAPQPEQPEQLEHAEQDPAAEREAQLNPRAKKLEHALNLAAKTYDKDRLPLAADALKAVAGRVKSEAQQAIQTGEPAVIELSHDFKIKTRTSTEEHVKNFGDRNDKDTVSWKVLMGELGTPYADPHKLAELMQKKDLPEPNSPGYYGDRTYRQDEQTIVIPSKDPGMLIELKCPDFSAASERMKKAGPSDPIPPISIRIIMSPEQSFPPLPERPQADRVEAARANLESAHANAAPDQANSQAETQPEAQAPVPLTSRQQEWANSLKNPGTVVKFKPENSSVELGWRVSWVNQENGEVTLIKQQNGQEVGNAKTTVDALARMQDLEPWPDQPR